MLELWSPELLGPARSSQVALQAWTRPPLMLELLGPTQLTPAPQEELLLPGPLELVRSPQEEPAKKATEYVEEPAGGVFVQSVVVQYAEDPALAVITPVLVKKDAKNAGNQDREKFPATIVKAQESAKNVTECVEEPAGCSCVQNVEAPASAVISPVPVHGLNDEAMRGLNDLATRTAAGVGSARRVTGHAKFVAGHARRTTTGRSRSRALDGLPQRGARGYLVM